MDTLTFVLNQSEVPRSFLITDNVPEQGRSGGGLFLESGELAGVCIGHTEMRDGRRMGVFASRESIQVLLEGHNLKAAVLRSESARAHRRASLPGSPQHEEEEADRQEPEDRQTAWSGIEEKDQRQEQAEHKAGQEHQPRAAGVRESAFGRAGAREFQRRRQLSRRSAGCRQAESRPLPCRAVAPGDLAAGTFAHRKGNAPGRPSYQRGHRARPGSTGTDR